MRAFCSTTAPSYWFIGSYLSALYSLNPTTFLIHSHVWLAPTVHTAFTRLASIIEVSRYVSSWIIFLHFCPFVPFSVSVILGLINPPRSLSRPAFPLQKKGTRPRRGLTQDRLDLLSGEPKFIFPVHRLHNFLLLPNVLDFPFLISFFPPVYLLG